jgi:hypothetical protein
MAAHADSESDFSVLRNSELGRASCGVAAHYRISGGADSGVGVLTAANSAIAAAAAASTEAHTMRTGYRIGF